MTPRLAIVVAILAWASACAGVDPALKAELSDVRAEVKALRVAIGPSIRVCCYVVGQDLADQFRARFGPEVAIEEDGQLHLDLVRAIRWTLRRAGVPEEAVEVVPDCTSCEPSLYYSHRRDHGNTGRHLAFVSNERAPPEPVS